MIETLSSYPPFIGSDERIHPIYNQLGSQSGRIVSNSPAIQNLDSLLRSVIIPKEGYCIGVCDYSQFDIFIAAGLYKDPNLLRIIKKDIYSEIAKKYLKIMKLNEFSKQARDTMKRPILSIINSCSKNRIAKELYCSVNEAHSFYNDFMDRFPTLKKRRAEMLQSVLIEGYISTITNLQWNRPEKGTLKQWERNFLLNFPLQANGAIILKKAVMKLDALYKKYNARLILTIHDSIVFECPPEHLRKIVKLTKRVMKEIMIEFFPDLKPKVTFEFSEDGWSNDDEIDRWFERYEKNLIS